MTPQIPSGNRLAQALLEVSDPFSLVSPLPSGTPTFQAPSPLPPPGPPLPTLAPRGSALPGFQGSTAARGQRRPPVMRAPPPVLPGGHRAYPAQSGSGKLRPRRSCRRTWRQQVSAASAPWDRSEATGLRQPGPRPGFRPSSRGPITARSLPGAHDATPLQRTNHVQGRRDPAQGPPPRPRPSARGRR